MRSGASSVQHLLTPAALGVLKHAITEARRRGHPQVQPLHVVSMLLTHAGSRLRQACMLSHPQNAQTAECRALEVCFNVALDHLSQSAMAAATQPILSNALMAALKRAHAHQRRGCPEHQQSPLLAVKVEIDQLIISILDDPSVSRVMKEAGFSSTNVKFNLEDGAASVTVASGTTGLSGLEQHGADIVSQVTSYYDTSSLVSDETDTKTSIKFSSNPATSMTTSWPQSDVSLDGPDRMYRPQRGIPAVAPPPIGLPAREEDVQSILDILARPRNRNAILVADTTTAGNAMLEDLSLRIKNGSVSSQLQGLQFLDPKLSSSSFGYCSSLEMEQKLTELSKIVEECMPAGAILHIGDLQWLAEPMQLKKGPSNFCPAQRTASELRQLLIRHANNRLWFVGVATPHIFARLQALYPSLTSDWGLEPVHITAKTTFQRSQSPFLQRFMNTLQNVNDQQAMSAVTATRTGSPPILSSASAPAAVAVQDTRHEESNGGVGERFQCCAECLAKFEEERRLIHENESLSLQLAPVKWFSLSSDKANSEGAKGAINQVKLQSVAQKLSQLQQICQKTCRMLHGEPMPVLTARPQQQQQLQSPLSRLSASSHSKPCGMGLDMSSRWSGPGSRQQLGCSVVDQPLRTPQNISAYAARERVMRSSLQVQETVNSNVKPAEAPELGSPKDGSSVASAPEDHEDPNGSTGASVQDPSLASIHTTLALGRGASGGLTTKKAPPKPLAQFNDNPSPLQQQSVGASPLRLKNGGKPLWLLQSPLQSSVQPLPVQPSPLQQRMVKSNVSWQSSPLARRRSLQPAKSPSPPPAAAPFKEITVDDNLKGLYKGLMQRVPWQAAAVAGISATVMKCRSGMGSFRGATAKTDTWLLLLGPDPVAKHAIAKALAELVFGGERNLLHLGFGDGSRARLEAADNGMRYRGKTPLDRLVEAVRMMKSAVILLEDIDKANSMVRSSIVRAMEIGKLADSTGREVSFGNTIVVMTTSIGSDLCEPKSQPGDLSFSESKLAAMTGKPTICVKIKDSGCEQAIFRSANNKLFVVNNEEQLQQPTTPNRSPLPLEVPSWVTKRKPNFLLNGELRPKLDGKRTKSDDGRFLNLDLNLASGACTEADGEEDCGGEEYDSVEAKLQKILAEARDTLSHKFCELPDYAVGFEAYDFNGLATLVLNKLGKSFATHAPGEEVSLEIDLHLVEHIISCVWKMPGGRPAFNAWLEDVFANSIARIQIPTEASGLSLTLVAESGGAGAGFEDITIALPPNIVFSSL